MRAPTKANDMVSAMGETVSRRVRSRRKSQIAGEDDSHGIEDRPIHVSCCARMTSFRLYFCLPAVLARGKCFDHHHGAIDDDSEIDCADGKQIRGYIVGVENDEGKQKREGMVRATMTRRES